MAAFQEVFRRSGIDLLVELGRMKTVGGQEDLIEDVAIDMAAKKQK